MIAGGFECYVFVALGLCIRGFLVKILNSCIFLDMSVSVKEIWWTELGMQNHSPTLFFKSIDRHVLHFH